ncbi:MAG: hypothetical protein ACR2PC_04975 [Tsuneonella suprasediminis]|nr:hypothetical protein LBX01_15000 [Altererythrobacter sp. N1]
MRVWSYVITTDRGSAPNFEAPAVTLTVCKPRIEASRVFRRLFHLSHATISRFPLAA